MIHNFNKALNIGVDPEADSDLRIKTQIVNIIAIMTIIMATLGIVLTLPNDDQRLLIGPICITICGILTIYLNYISKFLSAKLIAFFGSMTIQFLSLYFLDNNNNFGAAVTFIPIAVVAPILFLQRWLRIFAFLYLSTLFVTLASSKSFVIDNYFVINLLFICIGMLVGVYIIITHLQTSATNLSKNNEKLILQNERQKELITQNELKTELLGMLSHDLKGPAAAFNQLSKKVSFLLEKERYDELEKFGKYFEYAGDKIYHDIDRLLNWTIAQKEDIIIRHSTFQPFKLMQRIIEGIEFQVKDKFVNIDNTISKNLIIVTDQHILEIILKNLMINAANHSPDNATVKIDTHIKDDQLIIRIINGGGAIDKDIVVQARAGKYRKSEYGHGLGLGICFSLVRFLNAELTITPFSEHETLAALTLPLSLH